MHKVLYTALTIFLVQAVMLVFCMWPTGVKLHKGHVVMSRSMADSFGQMETNLSDMRKE